MCLKLVYKWVYGVEPPRVVEKIDSTELRMLLQSEFPRCQILLTDNEYKVTSFEEYQRFITCDSTDLLVYVSEFFDCDDFALRLHGNITVPGWSDLAFGHMFTLTENTAHAVNVFVDIDREVWVVEPQNDHIFRCREHWKPYFIEI